MLRLAAIVLLALGLLGMRLLRTAGFDFSEAVPDDPAAAEALGSGIGSVSFALVVFGGMAKFQADVHRVLLHCKAASNVSTDTGSAGPYQSCKRARAELPEQRSRGHVATSPRAQFSTD